MSENKPFDIFERIDRIAGYFLREIGSMGVQEITIDSTLFDMVCDHSFRYRYWIDAEENRPKSEKDLPLKSILVNAHGRPVLIKRGKK